MKQDGSVIIIYNAGLHKNKCFSYTLPLFVWYNVFCYIRVVSEFMWEMRNAYRLLVVKREGKRPLGRLSRRWVDNIKMDLGEIDLGILARLVWLRKRTGEGFL
jgi:hypothetical protein